MEREMGCRLDVNVFDPTELILQVAVAKLPGAKVKDQLTIRTNGGRKSLKAQEVLAATGTRMHILSVPAGPLTIEYEATVKGRFAPVPVTAGEVAEYLRPSRFVESDLFVDVSAELFGHIEDPATLVVAVSNWVGTLLRYVPGSSGPTTGAVETHQNQQGVCRDYAHLTAAMLRARGMAARMVGVYAPGCNPMDFHAVVEADVNGVWQVVDSTLLAPRQSLVRMSTGRDAADTAFLSNNGGAIEMGDMTVTAIVDGRLPIDDPHALVELR